MTIKQGQLFYGKYTEGSGGGSDEFAETFGENIYHLYDDRDENGLIPFFTKNSTEIEITGVKNIPSYWANGLFIDSIATKIIFNDLVRLSGASALNQLGRGSQNLKEIRFKKLEKIETTSSPFAAIATNGVENIYFEKLNSKSFLDNGALSGTLNSSGTTIQRTIHFPSNLEPTIQGLTGYPNFGGTNGYVTLAYDLPATS